MPQAHTNPLRKAAIIVAAASLMSGCSLITATTDATVDGIHATTNTTSSTSHSFDADARSRAVQFVRTDLDAIRVDAARGHGDEIDSLAYLLNEPDPAAFGRWMQAHYVELFVGLDKPEQLLTRIDRYRPEVRTASVDSPRHGG